jgi:predicted TPR repeat methyltransferase
MMTSTPVVLRPNPLNAIFVTDDEYLVYCQPKGMLHKLNGTAAFLYELCDGKRTRNEVVSLLGPEVSDHSPQLRAWLEKAEKNQLLLAEHSKASIDNLRRSELFAREADTLRDNGAILAAFVCQSQACELAPENAEHWLELGELAHILGRRAEAREAYRHFTEMRPDNAEARLILLALSDEAPPARAPDDCIRQLYARFSGFYEENMCGDLGYEAPRRLQELLDNFLNNAGNLQVLELGCGTGLSGKVLRQYAAHLIGVDLCPEMVSQCQTSQLYDQLEVAEITAFLARKATEGCRFDLVAACDTLIYFGDLSLILKPSANVLKPQGYFAFTVEKGAEVPYKLNDSGRFSHSESHIRSTAEEAGFDVLSLEEGFLRYEYGEPVTGFSVMLKKRNPQ